VDNTGGIRCPFRTTARPTGSLYRESGTPPAPPGKSSPPPGSRPRERRLPQETDRAPWRRARNGCSGFSVACAPARTRTPARMRPNAMASRTSYRRGSPAATRPSPSYGCREPRFGGAGRRRPQTPPPGRVPAGSRRDRGLRNTRSRRVWGAAPAGSLGSAGPAGPKEERRAWRSPTGRGSTPAEAVSGGDPFHREHRIGSAGAGMPPPWPPFASP
jgi:hypothetical protein